MLLAALLGLNGALGRSATLGPYERILAALHTSFLAIPYTRLLRLAEGLILAPPGRYPRVIQKPGLVEVHVHRVHLQDTVKAHDLLYPALKVLLRRGPTSQLHDAVLGCADP